MNDVAVRSALVLLVFGLAVAVYAQTPTGLLLAAEPGAVANLADFTGQPGGATVLRLRPARVDGEVLNHARVDARRPGGAPLRLNLFEDIVLDVEVERTGPTSGGYWLSGRIAGPAPGSLTLVVNGQIIAGTVRVPDGLYDIQPAGDGQVVIRQVDPSTLPRCAGVLPPRAAPSAPAGVRPITPPSPARAAARAPGGLEDGSRIDVLVVFGGAGPCRQDRDGACLPEDEEYEERVKARREAQVDLFMAETNQAFADSGVRSRINLVAARATDYTSPSYEYWLRRNRVALDHLADPEDGFLDEVHAWRDEVAADIVVLLLFDGVGGVAYLLPSSDWAFAVSGPHGGTFAHELGHLMGAAHDRYEQMVCSLCESEDYGWDLRRARPFPYSFGYVNQRAFEPGAPQASRWGTIMAYHTQCSDAGIDCHQLLRFSNPDQTWEGDPLGVPGDKASSSIDGPADVRRTFNETRRLVANHRIAPCLTGGTRVRLRASNGQYVVAVGNGGGEVLADGSKTDASGRFTVVDANGGCVEHRDVISLRTADAFYLRAVGGGGSTVDATAPRATPWARFTVRRGRGTGAVRGGDSVTLQTHSGQFVSAEGGGGSAVRADSASPGVWGRFKVVTGGQ